MKRLKFKFDLDCKVSVYVPSTINVNEHTDNSEQVKKTITALCKLFGGATASRATGGWVCETGETILEDVVIVYSFCTSEQLAEHFHEVIAICERIKSEMAQEAVTLEVNGQVSFI